MFELGTLNPELETFFSPDYVTARNRFRAAARDAGATLDSLALEARGPQGEDLTIDIACLGPRGARRVLLHTSGLHGVEAFAGSAVQLAALADPPPPGDCVLVIAHVLNPYGMAWLRRANENNVDLNRNFLSPGARWEGAPALYTALDRLLNPPTPPGRDFFHSRLWGRVLRHGMRPLKQAIAEGQYEFPRGLFYGGKALEPGPAAFLEWLRTHLSRTEYLFALDLHTGLGRRGVQTLILEPGVAATPAAELSRALGSRLVNPGAGEAAYTVRGGMGGALPHALPALRIDFVLQEIATYRPYAVTRALREENRWHHHGGASIEHPAKLALREALCPDSVDWRRRAVAAGLATLRAAAAWTFRQNP